MKPGLQLGLFVIFALAGWQQARRIEKTYGRAAYGMPAWLWAVITGLSLLIGALLLYSGEKRLKKQPPVAYSPMPVYGQVQVPVSAPAMAPAGAVPGGVEAGWQPDPSGKFQLRWWDGAQWTSSVSTNGVTSTDA